MAEYFAGGHLRFVYGEWRDDKRYCIDKIHDILQKYYLGRSEENPYIYKLFPRKDGDLNG